MQQLLHLLIVDRDRREGLATVRGSRWLLPIVCCSERTRAGPLAAAWIAEHGFAGHMIGQWLGRVTPASDAIDWLVVVDARHTSRDAAPSDMRWTPLEHLKASASLLDYQQWALEKAVPNDLPLVAGPFGSMTWFDGVREWANSVCGALADPPICYKATPYEVVLGVVSARGTVYFKGLTGERVTEATLTSTVANELPDSFARTLAFERRPDESVWWLTEQCAGTTAAADLTRDRMVLVASALGPIQQHFRDRTTDLHLPDADLPTVVAWARAVVREHVSSETADRCDAALARAQRSLSTADLPCSWIPLDLDVGNVLVDNDAVRFIDLDDSRIGAAPIALATFLRRVRRMLACSKSPMPIDHARCAYETGWTPHLDLGGQWLDVEAASMLLECHLGWRQLSGLIERGEVHGARDLAGTSAARRLARALNGGVDSPQGRR